MLMMLVLQFTKSLQSMEGTATQLLWVQRPENRTESLKRNPADAHDARAAVRQNNPTN